MVFIIQSIFLCLPYVPDKIFNLFYTSFSTLSFIFIKVGSAPNSFPTVPEKIYIAFFSGVVFFSPKRRNRNITFLQICIYRGFS